MAENEDIRMKFWQDQQSDSDESNKSCSDVSCENTDEDSNYIGTDDESEFDDSEDDCVFKEDDILNNLLDGEMNLNECLNKMDSLSKSTDQNVKESKTLLKRKRAIESVPALNKELYKDKEQKRRKVSKLDPALLCLVGEANVNYMLGNKENAYKICVEMIREKPLAAQPYRLLSLLYEEAYEYDKALQLKLIAAYVGPTKVDDWISLSDDFKEKGDIKLAISCVSKAINLDGTNLTYYVNRAALLTEIGSEKYAMKGFTRLMYKLDSNNSIAIQRLCRMTGRYFSKQKELTDACIVFKYMFDNCAKALLTSEDMDNYMGTLLETQNYKHCVELFCKFYNIQLESECKVIVSQSDIDKNIEPGVYSKLIVSMIHLGNLDMANNHLQILMNKSFTSIGREIYSIAIAYMEVNEYEKALKLLSSLKSCSQLGTDPEVWIKLAECYDRIGDVENNIKNYYKAVKLCPEHFENRLSLCRRLKSIGRYKEALAVTFSNDGKDLYPSLIHERCEIYFIEGDEEEFLKSGYKLLSFSTRLIKTKKDLDMLYTTMKNQRVLKSFVSAYGALNKCSDEIPGDLEWDIFLKMCKVYMRQKKFDLLQMLTFSLFLSNKLQHKKKDINFAAVLSCLFNRDYKRGFDLLCFAFVNRKIQTTRTWNLLNLFASKVNNAKVNKFLVRAITREPDNFVINALYANYCLLSRSYRYALNDFFVLYKKRKDPLIAFELAVTSIQIACQKHTTNKTALVTQAVYFLHEYEMLRGPFMMQEIYYNMGRAFHQLGFVSDAAYYYKKVLETPSVFPQHIEEFDLSHEAAFNLSLIYMESNCEDLAEYYIQNYIVV